MHTLYRTAAVVTAGGDIDLDTAPGLHRDLVAALRSHQEVVLDLSGVEFMDCSGLGAILRAQQEADRRGARLVLRTAGRQVRRLLDLTGANRCLTVEP
ncbi:STAS domain-containing protein [Streptomyces sp. SP17BM10]|uniref:STAS domain-containing protein n=1 Tax=Streptomyces sp. SP17BM10 TaxID=3002530 RepID=UPI002E789D08|nr:STAS domain-containing protein [Streptomyces sp. SP17BM10]MEE1787092.1 STAS domain-containing protein [Streptomyces sp. SP17BM10]